MSAHFALAYSTITTAMVPFAAFDERNVRDGPGTYRMLPGLIWDAFSYLLHPLSRSFPAFHFPRLNKPLASPEDWFVVLLTFASMLGTLSVARLLLRAIGGHGQPWGFEWIALGMGYAAYFDTVLVLNRNLYYPYDLPALFLFTLLIYLAYVERPLLFSLVLMLAMTNKETAIMTVPIYFGLNLGRGPEHPRGVRLAAMCAGMAGLAVGVRVAQRIFISHVCSSCRGMHETHLADNLRQLPNPLFWVSEASVFGFAYIAAALFWPYVPRRVRLTAVAVYIVWTAAMAWAGVLREVRVFSELSALLLLVVGTGVDGWLKERRAMPLDAG